MREEHEKSETVILHQTQASYAAAVNENVNASRPGMGNVADQNTNSQPIHSDNTPEVVTPEMMVWRSMQQGEDRLRREEEERKRKAIEAEKQKYAKLMPMKGPQLLQQIRTLSRDNLKKVEPVKREAPKDQRSDLLDAIRSTKTLRHVETQQSVAREESKKGEGGIYAILKRREYLEESDESDTGSEWGSESD